jgi:hypothetical protein
LLIEKFIRRRRIYPFLEHKKAGPSMAGAITEKFTMVICSALFRQCAKGLYAGKRSFHSRGIITKVQFWLE